MSVAARLAKLEADGEAAEPDGLPLVVWFDCTPDTTPPPGRPGDAAVYLAPGEELPGWAGDRPRVYIPAETGPNDMPADPPVSE